MSGITFHCPQLNQEYNVSILAHDGSKAIKNARIKPITPNEYKQSLLEGMCNILWNLLFGTVLTFS